MGLPLSVLQSKRQNVPDLSIPLENKFQYLTANNIDNKHNNDDKELTRNSGEDEVASSFNTKKKNHHFLIEIVMHWNDVTKRFKDLNDDVHLSKGIASI